MSHLPSTSVAVVGLGQLGTIFADGFARLGRAVLPIRRGELAILEAASSASPIVLALPEDAVAGVVGSLSPAQRARVVLVQNELLPARWREDGLDDPTVAVVWFERKGGRAPVPLLPTLVSGPHAADVVAALGAVGLAAEQIPRGLPLVRALVGKNLYIRVANLGGLAAERAGVAPGGMSWPTGVTTMGDLLGSHAVFARALARELFELDLRALGEEGEGARFEDAWSTLAAATAADPSHACKGRAAAARLARAARQAEALGLSAPIVEALAAGPDGGGS